jgi:RNA polymerase sigma factor (sigma-70 family)
MDHLRGTDEALVAQLVNGNMAAFEELMERYRNAVYHTAFAILGDWAYAEDVVQEVFLSVLNNAHRFRGDSSFKTWVFRICTNSALNWRRQLRRRVLGFGRLRHEYASTDEDVLDVMLELQKLSPVHRATAAVANTQTPVFLSPRAMPRRTHSSAPPVHATAPA